MREGGTSQEHAFYGRKVPCHDNVMRLLNSLDRHQGPNHRIWVLQDTVSRGYNRKSLLAKPAPFRNGCIIDQVELENLPWERETVGFWLDIPKSLLRLFVDQEVNPAGAKHPRYPFWYVRLLGVRFSRSYTFRSTRRVELHTNVRGAPDGM